MSKECAGNREKKADYALIQRFYELATGEDDARFCRDIPERQCQEQPRNFLYQILAQTLSKIGDALSDSKVILPWVLGLVGAPAFFVGLLVPIRESLALLPQVIVGGVIRKFSVRKGFWIFSSLIEGICVIAMGIIAGLGVAGSAAGWAIIVLLVIFSLARGVASIASKDTLGKTVSKGRRGRVSGYAASISGAFAVIVGLYFALTPESSRPDWLLYALLVSAGFSWILAAAVFSFVLEFPGATAGGRGIFDLVGNQIKIVMNDLELQKFLLARSLMISTALAGPMYVALAQRETGMELGNLGWLMISTGLAAAVSSIVWGIFSDRSSKLTMSVGALMAGTLGIFVIAIVYFLPAITKNIAFHAIVLFMLGIAHSGVRIGRKTHIVDLAVGDQKSDYVAISNTLIGIVLLILGVISSILLGYSLVAGIAVMAVLALLGASVCLKMQHVQ